MRTQLLNKQIVFRLVLPNIGDTAAIRGPGGMDIGERAVRNLLQVRTADGLGIGLEVA
jgi:hypothetical protein